MRQYFPEDTTVAGVTQDDLNARLNSRPRETLGCDTPADRLALLLR
ncbi:hypothetical protein [Streptomyces sp. NPDC057557]